eukprot:Mycagemm_TRINITY_DN10260_c0_g1::TRINITY_DN10260_c0_g1_i1::g.4256::m.4256 type:complete len:240 gc:universal TRINITY_DN10260_c0_g1_i1:104-823(+)
MGVFLRGAVEDGILARESRLLEHRVVNQRVDGVVVAKAGGQRGGAVALEDKGEDGSEDQGSSEHTGANDAGEDVGLADDGRASGAVVVAADVGRLGGGGIALLTLVELAVAAEAALALGIAARELRRNAKVALLTGVDLAVTALTAGAGLGAAVLEGGHGPVTLLAVVELAVTALAVGILGIEDALLLGVAGIAGSVGGISGGGAGSAGGERSESALAGRRCADARGEARNGGLAGHVA